MSGEVAILVHEPRFRSYRAHARKVLVAGMKAQKAARASVTVVLSSDKEVRVLNHDYRGKDKPTNVLSFPDGDVADGVRQLGDIVLAYETIAAEARAQGKSFKAHFTHLLLHGLLHLLGHDHVRPAEAKRMEKLEISMLSAMGIANPYVSD